MPFSKGTRNCIGQPLAHAEIYMTLAHVLRMFCRLERDGEGGVVGVKGMRLYEMGFPSPEEGRGNVRIVLE
jgi:cytochrome P450